MSARPFIDRQRHRQIAGEKRRRPGRQQALAAVPPRVKRSSTASTDTGHVHRHQPAPACTLPPRYRCTAQRKSGRKAPGIIGLPVARIFHAALRGSCGSAVTFLPAIQPTHCRRPDNYPYTRAAEAVDPLNPVSARHFASFVQYLNVRARCPKWRLSRQRSSPVPVILSSTSAWPSSPASGGHMRSRKPPRPHCRFGAALQASSS